MSNDNKEFILEIITFYKYHIKKLKEIILEKQGIIDNLYSINNENTNIIEEFKNLKQENNDLLTKLCVISINDCFVIKF